MDPFWLKLILSFVVGGVWITLTTVAAERFGSKVGGLLGGIPSTVVVSMFFIGWSQGPDLAHQATTVFPFAFSFNAAFLIAFAVFAQKGVLKGILGAIGIWLLCQALVVAVDIQSYWLSVLVWLTILLGAYWVMQKWLQVESHERVSVHYTVWQVAWRAGFSGAMIAFSVLMSRWGGPVWGGIFAAFPAVYTSTLVITSRTAGVRFARAMITPLMISGVVNCVVYSTVFRFTILDLGIIGATLVAYAISMISAYGTWRFIQSQLS